MFGIKVVDMQHFVLDVEVQFFFKESSEILMNKEVTSVASHERFKVLLQTRGYVR